jgi:hypothetical protein
MENIEEIGEGGRMAAGEAEVGARPARRWSLAAVLGSRGALLALGAVLIGAVFWYLQFSTSSICCGDYDAYYHFRWSQMLWQGMTTGHFPPSFDALPLTTLNPKDYVDHHLLFHILQIPFTWFKDFQAGAKVGTWLFACLAVFSCYWLVIKNRISYPLVWLVAIIGSAAPFLYRMNMGKAMSVSIVLLVLGIHFLFERKYLRLLPLAFVFALTYDLVFLLWAAAFFWLIVTAWQERALNREVVWALSACVLVLLGTALGFVINPYFPHNLQLLYEHIIIKVRSGDFSTSVGNEWYAYTTWEFLGNCGVALAAMFAGYIAFRNSVKKEQRRAFFFLLFSTALMVVNARWRRFAEYFPPFAVLFAAFAVEPLIRRARARFIARETVAPDEATSAEASTVEDSTVEAEAEAARADEIASAGRTPAPEYALTSSGRLKRLVASPAERARAWEFVIVCTAFVLLCAPTVWYARVTSQDIAGMAAPNFYRGGMEWLSKNADKGELIFNTDWDDFPKLFFYNPDFAYVSGLDPTYLLDRDKKLSDLYARITIGKDLSDEEVSNLGPLIRDNFCIGEGEHKRCARYTFSDHEHQDFYNSALDSGWFDEVYHDDDCSILRMRDQKGTPPPDNSSDDDQPDDSDDDNSQGN